MVVLEELFEGEKRHHAGQRHQADEDAFRVVAVAIVIVFVVQSVVIGVVGAVISGDEVVVIDWD